MDQSIVKFFDFKLELLTTDSVIFFSQHYLDTVQLNVFDDDQYNVIEHTYSTDYIPELKEKKDSILVNYHMKTIDANGTNHEIDSINIHYNRVHFKAFGSLQ